VGEGERGDRMDNEQVTRTLEDILKRSGISRFSLYGHKPELHSRIPVRLTFSNV